jgi:hypothetical protein
LPPLPEPYVLPARFIYHPRICNNIQKTETPGEWISKFLRFGISRMVARCLPFAEASKITVGFIVVTRSVFPVGFRATQESRLGAQHFLAE